MAQVLLVLRSRSQECDCHSSPGRTLHLKPGKLAGGSPALRDFAGVRLRCVDLFLLFERNGQNEQQSDQSECGERNESKHQDGHHSLLSAF